MKSHKPFQSYLLTGQADSAKKAENNLTWLKMVEESNAFTTAKEIRVFG